MADTVDIFDRGVVRAHRDRAARLSARSNDEHGFLFREVAERLIDRLDDVPRKFPLALDLGCRNGVLARLLGGRGGIGSLIQCDLSLPMVERAAQGLGVVADDEWLPFAGARLDLVLSSMSLHWVNDLPGALVQIRRALKADGLFMAAMLGGETLRELRHALLEADLAEEGGASPRVSPFVDVRDAGDLLQRAGFVLPVADTDTLTVTYDDPLRLMSDLREMGETNAIREHRDRFSRRATFARAADIYRQTFAAADGRVPATFQIVYLTGWTPGMS
jgi:SAM-dependent methyltransferase